MAEVVQYGRFCPAQRSIDFRAEFFNLMNHFNPDTRSVDLKMRSATHGPRTGDHHTRNTTGGAKFRF
jgi:hypothetical protein